MMSSIFRRTRVWVGLVMASVVLLAPSAARAQGTLWWTDDGASFATFGPNSSVTINTGFATPGTCDFIYPATDIYVVNVSTLNDHQHITDVSNAQGVPNTVFLASGGLFIDETIGNTSPAGALGPGVYGVVFDECQNGIFDAGVDTLFYPAFEVVIPSNIPILPSASILATKAAAGAEADSWNLLMGTVNAIETLMEIKDTLECLSGGLVGCAASMAISQLEDYLKEQVMGALGLVDPKDAAKDAVVDTISHYGGIAADPPDPNFNQPDPIGAVSNIPATDPDPLVNRIIGIGNAQRTQAAILTALLHSIERYQGADQANNLEWALVHARSIQALASSLSEQLPGTNAALAALDAALTADTRDFDAGSAAAAPLIAQIVTAGFNAEQQRALLNAGFAANQFASLRAFIAAKPPVAFTKAGMHDAIAGVQADNTDLAAAMASLATEMQGTIVTLISSPNLPPTRPIANAGGPYNGVEGSPITLNGSASSDPNGTITAYAWDLDRDGQFDDATGATPSVTFASAFTGLVGLQVTDNSGNTSVDYALVTLSDVNHPPVIASVSPADHSVSVPLGGSQAFSIVASDPDGDPITVRWLVDFVQVASGPSLSQSLTFNTVGQRRVRVEVSDNNPGGGMTADEWRISVEAPDADGDGWRANAECDDGNPLANPGQVEIPNNGVDDDCNPNTIDTDPDLDHDGVLNAVDNCLLVPNPNQSDIDHNGVGDACQNTDGDAFLDINDNCPTVASANTADGDGDGIGDVCDPDLDNDGVLNAVDNCPTVANPSQSNVDGDAQGDACDADIDNDGVANAVDNCPAVSNTNQLNTDGDAFGDACDTDFDGDTVLNAVDNCPLVPNPTQSDVDHNGVGDACQNTDGDAFLDINDNCPTVASANVSDLDHDGLGDVCDPDIDNDTVLNGADNCPTVANQSQSNVDGDAQGDACDADMDNDTVLNATDNCPSVPNSNQRNTDGDSLGDACDPDIDDDTVLNAGDNCPLVANTSQTDTDHDNFGDACDSDMDNDGLANGHDNCPLVVNPDQADVDQNGIGNLCQDTDEDTILDINDNCPTVPNTDQAATNAYGVGNACVAIPVTVPWLGIPSQPHQVYSGGALVLQGVAVNPNSSAATITGATWDPGDGSGPVAVPITNPLALERSYTYTGAPGTPYTARLTITFLGGFTRSDNFNVIVLPKTLDVEANMAIDKGLWNLHKRLTRTTITTQTPNIPSGNWTSLQTGGNQAATASTVQAFLVNNHREVGDRLEDPYVDDVARGLRYLETQLTQLAIGVQPAGNPDTNGNGIGLYFAQQVVYVTGQIADAFVATGTPTATAKTGLVTYVRGRTYRDLVQDMMDAYWWGQSESGSARGGWQYSFNSGSDNSTAQWGAITGLAGEAWNIPVPAFVKTENLNYWLKYSQTMAAGATQGMLGYNSSACAWSNCMSTTPSGLVQMDFDGVRNDPTATTDNEVRFQAAVKYIASQMRLGRHLTDTTYGSHNIYSLFAMAKAFRLAVDSDGQGNLVPHPVTRIDDNLTDAVPSFDWYRNDPVTPTSASPMGVARLLISRQLAAGDWYGGNASYWPQGDMSSAFAIIILSPTIFELGPSAVCTALPATIGAGDSATFNGSGSFHNDPGGTIGSYSWDFHDGSAVVTNQAPTSSTTHTFANLGTYNVSLTVADANGLAATSSCPVEVIAGNLPPAAVPGGPYNFCVGRPMVLDAMGSSDPEDGALTFAWDLSSPLNFTNAEGQAAVFNVTSAFAGRAPGSYQIGLRVTDDHAQATSVFPLINIRPAGDPIYCNAPPEITVPANITIPATSAAGAPATFVATANDFQDGDLTPVCAPASGTTFPIGTTTVTCTATDTGGATATGTFTVTVTNHPPLITPPANIVTPATSAAGAVVTFTASGTDVEDGVIPAVCVPATGASFPIATTTVNCTVTDTRGLSASGSFTVTVAPLSNTPPTFTPPANITTPATSAAGAAVTFTAGGNDAQDGPIPAVCAPASGATFAATTTTVNCTVTDSGGLSASGSFTVTVTPLDVAPIAITGGAFFMHDGYQEKVQLDVSVSPSGAITGGNSIKYYYTRTRMNLASTQILSAVVTGHTSTLTGLATINGLAGYSFTLTITDGVPDGFGIIVRRADGAVYYQYSQAASGGDLIIH